MKNKFFINILGVIVIFSMLAVIMFAFSGCKQKMITVYSIDGTTKQIPENEVNEELSKGWYLEKQKVCPDKIIIPETVTLEYDETLKIEVGFEPEYTTETDLIWTSSDINVVTVSEDGELTAVKSGNAIVTATGQGEAKSSCEVTVNKKVYPNTHEGLIEFIKDNGNKIKDDSEVFIVEESTDNQDSGDIGYLYEISYTDEENTNYNIIYNPGLGSVSLKYEKDYGSNYQVEFYGNESKYNISCSFYSDNILFSLYGYTTAKEYEGIESICLMSGTADGKEININQEMADNGCVILWGALIDNVWGADSNVLADYGLSILEIYDIHCYIIDENGEVGFPF